MASAFTTISETFQSSVVEPGHDATGCTQEAAMDNGNCSDDSTSAASSDDVSFMSFLADFVLNPPACAMRLKDVQTDQFHTEQERRIYDLEQAIHAKNQALTTYKNRVCELEQALDVALDAACDRCISGEEQFVEPQVFG